MGFQRQPAAGRTDRFLRAFDRPGAGAGGRAFLDSSGAALAVGVNRPALCDQTNSEEAGEVLGRPIVSDEDHAGRGPRASSDRCAPGLPDARRARDWCWRWTIGCCFAAPPPVKAISPIGAGDATLAGLTWAVVEGCDPVEMARRAIACGVAAALQAGTGVGDRPTILRLLGQMAAAEFAPHRVQ